MIAIRIDAGHQVGTGHLARMMNLAGELQRLGENILFLLKGDPSAYALLRQNHYSAHLFSPD